MVKPWVDEMTPWKVYSFGRSMTADWCPSIIFLQSSKLLTTTARVLPRRIWKTECLYLRHHFCGGTVRLRRWTDEVHCNPHLADCGMVVAELE